MKLIQRIGYYLGGFSLGLLILAFFLNGKKASCSYGPDARVLKNISTKKIIYGSLISEAIENKQIDTATIRYILKKGDINFSKSDTNKKPCATYTVEDSFDNKEFVLVIENCDSTATLQKLVIK
jgi:hypothetical protein